jgi:metal-dependent amidase/aminoacylase/carboxypeptidase family protein
MPTGPIARLSVLAAAVRYDIIPDKAEMSGTIRTHDETTHQRIIELGR